MTKMKVAILGCGAIGGMCLGCLSRENPDVIGIVKDYQKDTLSKDGLNISGIRGDSQIKVRVDTSLKEEPDLAIFATKTNNLEEIIKDNIKFLKNSIIVSAQNGIQADCILSNFFNKDRIVSGIVMFGATFYPPNKVVHNFEGDFILGNVFDKKSSCIEKARKILAPGFNTIVLENIKGAKYLKLFINLNNCIPAILGKSMQEVFSDLDLAKLAIKLNKEAYDIVTKSNIELKSLPTYPKERIQGLIGMPIDEAASLISKIMTNLSKEPLYGSILQSIKRERKSEIDYINGEIVHLAMANGLKTPLNKKIVELVHKIEDSKRFFTKQELLSEIKKV